MSIYLGDKLISGVATPIEPTRNIGQIIQSLLPLTDDGLHLLDGALIDGSGIHKAFVDYVKTIALTSSTCFITEEQWQTQVTLFGVCGKFVYDSSANTVRLPKVTGFLEGTLDASALGDLVEAGLPNITGSFGSGLITTNGESNAINTTLMQVTGAFVGNRATKRSRADTTTSATWWLDGAVGFDASKSNSIYGNSDTVQPQSIKGYLYIVIATGTKTDVDTNIDNVVTDLNGKADRDLTNVVDAMSTSAKSHFAGIGMPSSEWVALSLGASDSKYTAPANGYFTIAGEANASNGNIALINGVLRTRCNAAEVTGTDLYCFIPAKKGDEVTAQYASFVINQSYMGFWFVYAEGEV